MLRNLRAEMARNNITTLDISKVIHKTDKTVRNKINGIYEFTLPETTAIRDAFFPGLSLEYLFATEAKPST